MWLRTHKQKVCKRVNICSSVLLMRPEKLCHNENLTSVNQNKQEFNATLTDGRAPKCGPNVKSINTDPAILHR